MTDETMKKLKTIVKEMVTEILSSNFEQDDDSLSEVTPKGYEKIIKSLKKTKSVKNPYAIAYSMKKKGIKPKK